MSIIDTIRDYVPLSIRVAKGVVDNTDSTISAQNQNLENKNNQVGSISTRSELSKAGIANVDTGTREVLGAPNPLLQKTSDQTEVTESYNLQNLPNQGKQMIQIDIKDFILEEGLTQAIQNNANKISGGLLLGAGAAAAHVAGGGDFSSGLDQTQNQNLPGSDKWDSMTDHQKDLAKNNISTDVHNAEENPRGLFGNIAHGVGQGLDNTRAEHKIDDLKSNEAARQDILNRDGSLLTGVQRIGLGAAGTIGAAALGAARYKSKRK